MALIRMSGGFAPIPEGIYVFKIVEVEYKEQYGKLAITMQTAKGKKHIERFQLTDKDGHPNDGAMAAFSFLDEGDYEKPEDFVPNASNTKVIPFRLHERYPDFEVDYLDAAIDWWHTHVETGISPEYDEKADADILKALRTTTPDAGDDRAALIREAEALKAEIDEHAAAIKEKEDRYKAITDALKKDEVDHWKDGAKKVIIPGSRYEWTISRTDSRKVDTDALKTAGLYETYSKPETTYRVTVKEKKA